MRIRLSLTLKTRARVYAKHLHVCVYVCTSASVCMHADVTVIPFPTQTLWVIRADAGTAALTPSLYLEEPLVSAVVSLSAPVSVCLHSPFSPFFSSVLLCSFSCSPPAIIVSGALRPQRSGEEPRWAALTDALPASTHSVGRPQCIVGGLRAELSLLEFSLSKAHRRKL